LIPLNNNSIVDPAATAARKNLRTNYTNEVYENQRLLMGTLKGKFPSYFDDYIARVTSYMTENTCTILYSNSSTEQSGNFQRHIVGLFLNDRM